MALILFGFFIIAVSGICTGIPIGLLIARAQREK